MIMQTAPVLCLLAHLNLSAAVSAIMLWSTQLCLLRYDAVWSPT